MAQQASNPQREPSMDEILASIRRIIEESEPDRASADLSAIERLTGEPAAIGPAANDPTGSATTIERQAVEAKADVRPVFPEADSEIEMETELLSESFDAAAMAFDPELESAFRHLDAAQGAAPDLGPARVDLEPIAAAPEPIFNEVLADAITASAAEAPRAIISERTGRQVAASFGDLADAFASTRRRSFDEVAEEMMRPMLQDWMDNNLPMLVERLVREEIERVARGG